MSRSRGVNDSQDYTAESLNQQLRLIIMEESNSKAFIILGRRQSSQKPLQSLFSRGIILERQIKINFDRLYDIYELHQLATYADSKQKSFRAVIRAGDIDVSTEQLSLPKQIGCEICLHNPSFPLTSSCNILQKTQGKEKKQEDSDEESILEMIPDSISSEQTIYFTCVSEDLQRNLSVIEEIQPQKEAR